MGGGVIRKETQEMEYLLKDRLRQLSTHDMAKITPSIPQQVDSPVMLYLKQQNKYRYPWILVSVNNWFLVLTTIIVLGINPKKLQIKIAQLLHKYNNNPPNENNCIVCFVEWINKM